MLTHTIVYCDDRLLVLDKPSGLLAVPGRGPLLKDCLSARVQAERPGAGGASAGSRHIGSDRDGSRRRRPAPLEPAVRRSQGGNAYLAIVLGNPPLDQGTIDLPLRKDFDHPPRHCIDPVSGRPAQTHWRVVERLEDRVRLEIRPITGRSHQIRLHLATLGHPILGDNLYAHPAARAMAERLLLHASELSLAHPEDGRMKTWTAACPF